MAEYNHKEIETKWQKKWEENNINKAEDNATKQKQYILVEFPYPSGDGLHTGHVRSYSALDVVARKRRAEGYNVLYPIGWDAFGLPTENYAIKTGIHPEIVTRQNTDNFRRQLKSLGFSFDWEREVNTSDPAYYRWTQWIFIQLFNKGLAYKAKSTINWCPKDKIGLANEEVVGGNCERCGTAVEKREKEQWMLAITKYAERLDTDLDSVDFWDKIKVQQREWIGRSEGAEIDFPIQGSDLNAKIFTTRPDTILGATYLVLSPEHSLVQELGNKIENSDEVRKYIELTKQKSEIDRTKDEKEKTGVLLVGVTAKNPANDELIPIFIADYVLPHYGTGAIMAVPAHDGRDREFATKFNLPIEDKGLVDSKEIVQKVGGIFKTQFKLRDWVFSRQRYWGEPIPLVNCSNDGWVPVPDEQLPVVLPTIEDFRPTENGESPLAKAIDWINTKCPRCGGEAKRETDVMPNWAGSSWYYLRYTDPKNNNEFAGFDKIKYWTPVDWYNGGMEHTTLHLLYSRFWHKFLFDAGLVPTNEPYKKRTSHGLILASGGVKMSKSKGNVVSPDSIVERLGADTLRLYELFIGPFDQPVAWSEDGLVGPRRFIERVWKLSDKIIEDVAVRPLVHKTIKKVGEDIESMNFNTAVSALMILANDFEKSYPTKAEYSIFLQLLFPMVPHVASELWSNIGNISDISIKEWPKYDESQIIESEVSIAVQINGKLRGTIVIPPDADEEFALKMAQNEPKIKAYIDEGEPRKVIYVKGRILNIII